MHDPNPKLIIIAGPNGAGKSTIARDVVFGMFGISKYVNADTIARGLAEFDTWSVRVEAGKIMVKWVDKLVERREDFALETTLAGQKYAKKINEWRKPEQGGYNFHLIFVWLRSPEIAPDRVGVRVGAGGHDVPEEDIRRRYQRGICNFEMYKALTDTWRIFDNSDEKPLLIAKGKGNSSLDVLEEERWHQFCEAQNGC